MPGVLPPLSSPRNILCNHSHSIHSRSPAEKEPTLLHNARPSPLPSRPSSTSSIPASTRAAAFLKPPTARSPPHAPSARRPETSVGVAEYGTREASRRPGVAVTGYRSEAPRRKIRDTRSDCLNRTSFCAVGAFGPSRRSDDGEWVARLQTPFSIPRGSRQEPLIWPAGVAQAAHVAPCLDSKSGGAVSVCPESIPPRELECGKPGMC